MKTLKYTTAALALIAAAAFTTSANAQTSSATGDVILGIYDTASGGPPDYEVDLGAFSTLTAGETFTLGTSLANTFTSDSTPSLVFDIAASAGTGVTDLASGGIAFTAPSPFTYSVPHNARTSTPSSDIGNETNSFGTSVTTLVSSGTSSTGTGFQIGTIPDGTNYSFHIALGSPSYDYNLNGGPTIVTPYTIGSTVSTDFFTELDRANPVADGTFEITGTGASTELIFDPTAAPEPSTYVLMFGGLLALWAIKRSRKNA